MIDIEKLIRTNIWAIKPYSSARSLFTQGILMDANENPHNIFGGESEINRYPDCNNTLLRQKISALYNLDYENCAAGNGSDELIDLLIRIFCEPGKDEIIICTPTYGVYEVAAKINDINVIEIPLNNDFQLDNKQVLSKISSFTKIIFICSPNNPTGNVIDREAILELTEAVDALIVVDEAYCEFTPKPSLINDLKQYNNLVVLRTFSKVYAMAGIRLGYIFADKLIIEYLQKIKYPYNISVLNTNAVLNAIEKRETIRPYADEIILQRDWLINELQKIKGVIKVYPTDSNFILFKIENAGMVFKKLVDKGVIIRNRSDINGLDNCLRLSTGTERQNKYFIKCLRKVVEELT
ncbi:MAG: histidinol-phosphate transaminase [Bacteroidia bacterium]|nr:histidinol-phosphate transaminase [Bacteroidia bacterium]